jgi:hypothetical protein
MNESILIEIAQKWVDDAQEPECVNGAEEAKIGNAIEQGRRNGKRECADQLRQLIDLLGSKREADKFRRSVDQRSVARDPINWPEK